MLKLTDMPPPITNKFNSKLFNKIIRADLKALVKTVTMQAQFKAAGMGNPLLTADEIKELAHKYFITALSLYLYNNR